MERTTTPDKYTAVLRNMRRQYHDGEISYATFAMMMALVWRLRGNA